MKKKCSIKDGLSLTLLPKKSVSYAMQSARFSLFDEAVLSSALAEGAEDLVVTFGDDRGLIVSNQQSIALLPFQGSVALETSNLVNPAFLASLAEPTVCEVVCHVLYRGEPVLSKSVSVTALPMTAFDPAMPKELVACFVRTGTQEQKKLLSEAERILEKWKMPTLFTGYERDKNRAYQQFAALATALRERNLVRSEGEGEFLFTDRNNELSVALWIAGCLEDARLHPLILLGEKIAVGVWLYEGCLPVSVTDDMSFVENYVAKGVNNLAFVNAEDLFDGVEGNFTITAKRFLSALSEGAFSYCVDIRRARIEGYRPMPVRRETANGFELVECAELDREARPETLSSFRYTFDPTLPKEKRWERRLLDLTFRNPLLSFQAGRLAVPVLSSSLDETYFALSERKSLKLTHTEEGMKKTLSDQRNVSRLVSLELENGTLRSPMGEAELSETLSRIVRRGKEADEESGGNLVYLAFGFLHFFTSEKSDRKEIVSPLLLMPVRIGKSKGNLLPTVESAGEAPEVNTTLLEYLKQEYNIDVRGLDGNTEGLRIAEICAMIRMEVSGMKGWTVEESCYLSVFSFTRWFLWNDLRRNIDTFRLNPLVAAVYDGKPLADQPAIEKRAREDYAPGEVITPLAADETQFEAIALSRTGTSFVLHGPPGTGKSQTITNMIANALKDGKRVLFVAEKEAALSVVKKRLDAIGVGDFCLELHSSRADKSAVVSHFERTLALAGKELPLVGGASRVGEVEGELRKGMESMHRVRRIGVSV
ncbi:MAG: DUF4011 domain-containing protein, partial [Christensenellaceae bacterium]